MLTADIPGDHLVKVVARDFQRGGHSHAIHAQHRDVRGAAADVHNHVTAGPADIQPRAKARRQRLLDQEHTPGTGFDGGVNDASLLNLGHAGGDGHDYTGLGGE